MTAFTVGYGGRRPAEFVGLLTAHGYGAPLLLGARGRPPADVAALAAMLSRLSTFAVAVGPRLQAIDINPVLALPAGAPESVLAADAVIELEAG